MNLMLLHNVQKRHESKEMPRQRNLIYELLQDSSKKEKKKDMVLGELVSISLGGAE